VYTLTHSTHPYKMAGFLTAAGCLKMRQHETSSLQYTRAKKVRGRQYFVSNNNLPRNENYKWTSMT
jgi:hypothetical protein